MAETEVEKKTEPEQAPSEEVKEPAPVLHVAPSPHLSNIALSTRWMMYDVLIGLAPVIIMSVVFFGWRAIVQIGLCVISCMVTEAVFTALRKKTVTIDDGAAGVTGVILALSLPWSAPWYVPVFGSVIGVGLGKVVFGGLGFNIFNPAMVGRAFVMLSFPMYCGAAAYIDTESAMQLVTQATPLAAAKAQAASSPALMALFFGSHNGSLGETSTLACLLGGIYLCARRSASWEIPAGMLGTVLVLGALVQMMGLSTLTVLHQLCSGAVFLGAFFIATDPVTSPITPIGKFIFGVGVGFFTIIIRIFSGYPEGVMFAVLLMNAAVPLINQWTIPRPLGGLQAQKA